MGMFRSPLQVRGRGSKASKGRSAYWVRADSVSEAMFMRIGVKFYLHPLLTGDAIKASRMGMTKLDRYNHQYLVSLEVYALSLGSTEEPQTDTEPFESFRVGSQVTRSNLVIVATGNPSEDHRNWTLTMVGDADRCMDDPLDCFRNDSAAALSILENVEQDLQTHGRFREFKADFLLWTILDRSANQTTSISLAYAHRLRWLHKQLKEMKLKLPEEHVEEVSSIRLEMQELRLWVGQIRGILRTLAEDSKDTRGRRTLALGNFGMDAANKGKGLQMFLSNTDALLEQMLDRLATLDELAKSFQEHYQRHRDTFLNSILLTLTIATAVFMPAQLLSGIYGTNFVDDAGDPDVPGLRWRYGYVFFFTISFGSIVAGLILACLCLRR